MKLNGKRIAIIGGGPGGLTFARLLQLKGADVAVYERDADRSARVQGSPLDLHDESGLAAIAKADLLQEFKDNFLPEADRMKIVDPQAKVFYNDHDTKPKENFGHAHFRPEIDRGALRGILLESLHPETVVWGSHFISMERQNEGWRLHFKNGNSAYADIVVGADGANSKIRPYVTEIKAVYSGIMMLEGNIYDAVNTVPTISALLNGGKVMAFGMERNILMGQKANHEIGFYASFKADEHWAANSRLNFSDNSQLLEWFKINYPEWSSIWYELFENSATPLVPRPIYCMPPDQSWQPLPNLTLIGDAAHVMPPFAGEGVNVAMLDALELSEYLTDDTYATVHDAIAAYEISMRERAALMARASLENGERMHNKNALTEMLAFFSGYHRQG